jgi:hypothetical protein
MSVPGLQSHLGTDGNEVTAASMQDIEEEFANDLIATEAEDERGLAERYDEEAIGLNNGSEHNTRRSWPHVCK